MSAEKFPSKPRGNEMTQTAEVSDRGVELRWDEAIRQVSQRRNLDEDALRALVSRARTYHDRGLASLRDSRNPALNGAGYNGKSENDKEMRGAFFGAMSAVFKLVEPVEV